MPKGSFVVFMAFLALSSCANKDKVGAGQPSTTGVAVPRGINGLEVGMAPEQVQPPFKLKESENPVAALLSKYAGADKGKVVVQQDQSLQKRFFTISTDGDQLPEGITSADASSFHGVIYEIGFHYSEANVKKLGWEGITSPYLEKYGKPTEDTGLAYMWIDQRTRLDIQSSGSVVNVFFTDNVLERAVNKAQRNSQQ